jgi:hypothetical protein
MDVSMSRPLPSAAAAAFADELVCILDDSLEKRAGFLTNLRSTAEGFMHPMQGLQRGWNEAAWSMAGDLWKPGVVPKSAFGRAAQPLLRYMPGSKTFTVGAGVLGVPALLRAKQESLQGRSRAEAIGDLVGGTAGGLIGLPYGIVGGFGGSIAGGVIGRAVGKGTAAVGRLVKRPRRSAQTEQSMSSELSETPRYRADMSWGG